MIYYSGFDKSPFPTIETTKYWHTCISGLMMVDHSGNLRRWNAKYSWLYASWHVLFTGISTCNNFEESARAAWSEEWIDEKAGPRLWENSTRPGPYFLFTTEISISRGTWFCEIFSYLLNNRRSKFHKTACLYFCQSSMYRVEQN